MDEPAKEVGLKADVFKMEVHTCERKITSEGVLVLQKHTKCREIQGSRFNNAFIRGKDRIVNN